MNQYLDRFRPPHPFLSMFAFSFSQVPDLGPRSRFCPTHPRWHRKIAWRHPAAPRRCFHDINLMGADVEDPKPSLVYSIHDEAAHQGSSTAHAAEIRAGLQGNCSNGTSSNQVWREAWGPLLHIAGSHKRGT